MLTTLTVLIRLLVSDSGLNRLAGLVPEVLWRMNPWLSGSVFMRLSLVQGGNTQSWCRLIISLIYKNIMWMLMRWNTFHLRVFPVFTQSYSPAPRNAHTGVKSVEVNFNRRHLPVWCQSHEDCWLWLTEMSGSIRSLSDGPVITNRADNWRAAAVNKCLFTPWTKVLRIITMRERWQRGHHCELSSPPSVMSDIIKYEYGHSNVCVCVCVCLCVCVCITVFFFSISVLGLSFTPCCFPWR